MKFHYICWLLYLGAQNTTLKAQVSPEGHRLCGKRSIRLSGLPSFYHSGFSSIDSAGTGLPGTTSPSSWPSIDLNTHFICKTNKMHSASANSPLCWKLSKSKFYQTKRLKTLQSVWKMCLMQVICLYYYHSIHCRMPAFSKFELRIRRRYLFRV